MVAHLISLKLRILGNSLRRSPAQLVGLIFGALYGLFITALLMVLLVIGRGAGIAGASVAVVVGGSLLVLGWLVIPLIFSGVDSTLDVERFATFGIPRRSLLVGLGLAGLIGLPGLVTAVLSLGTVITMGRDAVSALFALLGAVLSVLLCISGSRALTTLLGAQSGSRKFKDLSYILVLVLVVAVGLGFGLVGQKAESLVGIFPSVAQVLAFTPLGAGFAAGGSAAVGSYGVATLQLAISGVSVALLCWLWRYGLGRALTTVGTAASTVRRSRSLGLLGRLPSTPTWAVTARSLTYFVRDPRYFASLLMAPIVGLFFIAIAFVQGQTVLAMWAGAIAVALVAGSAATDTSFDGTAFALHVSAGVKGSADRWGRSVAYLALSLLLGVVLSVLGALVLGRWDLLPAILGPAISAAGAGTGLGALFSAMLVFSVPSPGENPFKSRPGNNFLAALKLYGIMAGVLLLTLPSIILTLLAQNSSNPALGWASLVTGIILGGIFLVAGNIAGGKVFDAHSVRLLRLLSAAG